MHYGLWPMKLSKFVSGDFCESFFHFEIVSALPFLVLSFSYLEHIYELEGGMASS